MVRHFFIFILLSCVLTVSFACTRAIERLDLHSGTNPAVIEVASNELKLLKVDSTMVDIRHHGDQGSPYYCVSLTPGMHRIVTNCLYFREGSLFFLNAKLEAGHRYYIKTKVLNRVKKVTTSGISYPTTRWRVDVWVEDAETKERVSQIIKNI